jgi:hypothetical protein
MALKSLSSMRMECLKLANILATAKVIKSTEVLTVARGYFAYVDGDEKQTATLDEVERLRDRFSGSR